MPSNNKIEKTKKIGEKKTGRVRGKETRVMIRKGVVNLKKKKILKRIQQTLKKWKLGNLQTMPDHEGLQRSEKSSILKMALMCRNEPKVSNYLESDKFEIQQTEKRTKTHKKMEN